MKNKKERQEQALNKFGEHSYGSPQGAVLGKWGGGYQQQEPKREDEHRWPFMPVRQIKPNRRGRR